MASYRDAGRPAVQSGTVGVARVAYTAFDESSVDWNGASILNPNWIALAVFVAGAIVMLAMSRLRRHRVVDLGTVSHQWMVEQRFGHGDDPQR
jgi:hypothetical protein